jgi:hypothetical protein
MLWCLGIDIRVLRDERRGRVMGLLFWMGGRSRWLLDGWRGGEMSGRFWGRRMFMGLWMVGRWRW